MLQTEVIHNLKSLERYNFKRKCQQGTQSWILQDEGEGLQVKQVGNTEATVSEGLLAVLCCRKNWCCTSKETSQTWLVHLDMVSTSVRIYSHSYLISQKQKFSINLMGVKNRTMLTFFFFLGSRWRAMSSLIPLKMLWKCPCFHGDHSIFPKPAGLWLTTPGSHPSPVSWMWRVWHPERATWGLQKAMDVTCLELASRKHEVKGHT